MQHNYTNEKMNVIFKFILVLDSVSHTYRIIWDTPSLFWSNNPCTLKPASFETVWNERNCNISCIREACGSNLVRVTGYREVLHCFPESPSELHWNIPTQFPPTMSLIPCKYYYSILFQHNWKLNLIYFLLNEIYYNSQI